MKDLLADTRSPSAVTGRAWTARGLLRLVVTSNPFYVLSADLVFVGLRMSFDTHGKTFETWALMLALAGYTLLLGVTACLLVRLARVWEDVRTLLLLVVVMFLALSVTFDDTLTSHPRLGRICDVGGLLFAASVSEGLLWGLRLAMPWRFRAPYHAILALFFLYPIALSPLSNNPDSPALQWALFGFATLAGAIFLTLLPAIRLGPGYVAKNGSPWRWPFYPWVLFGLLGLGVCARAFYLCVSFHFVERSNSIFGLYFLVPFLLVLDLLLLEIGLRARSRAALRTALVLPLGLLVLAMAGHRPDPVYERFLEIFRAGLGGSPLYLTSILVACFYALAWLRSVPHAMEALAVSLGVVMVVGPDTWDLGGLVAPRPVPIAVLALPQLVVGLLHRDSWRCLLGAGGLIVALTLDLAGTGTPAGLALLALHLAIAVALALGAAFDDRLGRRMRLVGVVLLSLACLVALLVDPNAFPGVPPEVVLTYPIFAIAVTVGYGYLVGGRMCLYAAGVDLGNWLVISGWGVYRQWRGALVGLDHIVLGLAFFLLAALITLGKAGILQRWLARRQGEGYRPTG